MTKKKIAFITVARSDFGRLFPTVQKLSESENFDIQLIAAGNHTLARYGNSLQEIKDAGFEPSLLIESGSESIEDVSAAILTSLTPWLKKEQPDFLVILGDRFEMLAAAQAAFYSSVPIIHIGGGYQTLGAIDDKIRHAITQLSSIHLTATEACREKVIKILGTDAGVFLSGAPDLEILLNVEALSKNSFLSDCGLSAKKPFVLVTLHPETLLSEGENSKNIAEFERFLQEIPEQILITAPCADPGSDQIFAMIDRLKSNVPELVYIESLGMRRYVSAMKYALAMLGNSSSGIIESASMGLPVLNAGDRQKGRECNENVIHSSFELQQLLSSYELLKSEKFRKRCREISNIYGDGDFSSKFESFISIS